MESGETHQRVRAGYQTIHDMLLTQREIWAVIVDYHRLLYRCFLYSLIDVQTYFMGCSKIAEWQKESQIAGANLPAIWLTKHQLAEQVRVVVPVSKTQKTEKSALNNFKLNRAEIAQGRMFANPVVECLDVLKDGGTCLLVGLETLS